MPIALYPTYSEPADTTYAVDAVNAVDSKFSASQIVHDTSGSVCFVNCDSIRPFRSPRDGGARLLCGRMNIAVTEKKIEVPWLWEATCYVLPQEYVHQLPLVHWNDLVLHTDGEEDGEFGENRLALIAVAAETGHDLTPVKRVALFMARCLKAFGMRNTNLIKEGMEPANAAHAEKTAPEPRPYAQCPICQLPAPPA